MFRNFMLVAWRHLVRQPLYAILNVLGLAVGIAASLFILLYLNFELNFDEFHQHKDRLYRVETNGLKLRTREMDVDWQGVPTKPRSLGASVVSGNRRSRLLPPISLRRDGQP